MQSWNIKTVLKNWKLPTDLKIHHIILKIYSETAYWHCPTKLDIFQWYIEPETQFIFFDMIFEDLFWLSSRKDIFFVAVSYIRNAFKNDHTIFVSDFMSSLQRWLYIMFFGGTFYNLKRIDHWRIRGIYRNNIFYWVNEWKNERLNGNMRLRERRIYW